MVTLTNETQTILSFQETIKFNTILHLNLIKELHVLRERKCT